jgi:hypothetical protein
MKEKHTLLAALLAATLTIANCTSNATILNDTATALNPTTTATGSGSTNAELAKKLRSIWIVGGTKTSGSITAAIGTGAFAGDLDYYDPQTNTWGTVSSGSWTGTYTPKLAAAYAGYNGKIYVIGGFTEGTTGTTNTATVQIYDIATNAWSTGASLGSNLAAAGYTRVGTKVYLLNGTSANLPTTAFASVLTLNIYDISSNSWTTGTNLSVTGTEVCATNDGYAVYKASGKSAATTPGVSTTSWQFVNIQSSPTSNMLFGTSATATASTAASCVYLPASGNTAGRLLVIGGYTPTITGSATTAVMTPMGGVTAAPPPTTAVQANSFPHSGPFSQVTTLPTGVAYTAAVYTSSGIFVFGGNTAVPIATGTPSAPSNTVYASHPTYLGFYDTLPLTTTSIPTMPTARWGHGAVLVQ